MNSDQRGFIFTGLTLLLVLPAFLLVGAGLRVATVGQEIAAIQLVTDKVFFTAHDLERVLKAVWAENLLFDNQPNANSKLQDLEENYQTHTGLLVDLRPPIRIDATGDSVFWMFWIMVQPGSGLDPYPRYAGTEYCKISRVGDNWFYSFEDSTDMDFDEPVLRVERVGGDMRITLVEYGGAYRSDVYYGNTLVWENVGSDNVGISTTLYGRTLQLAISFEVTDPNRVGKIVENVGF